VDTIVCLALKYHNDLEMTVVKHTHCTSIDHDICAEVFKNLKRGSNDIEWTRKRDELTDRRTDGRTEGWTDGQTERQRS